MIRVCAATASVCLLLVCPAPASPPSPKTNPEDAAFFEQQVRPLLAEHCLSCHGPDKQKGGLRLDSRDSALAGGDSGPAIVPGKADQSLLLHAVRRNGELKMPPKGHLPGPAVAALAHWVDRGAPWPSDRLSTSQVSQAASTHWAFQPVRKAPVPAIKATAWSRTDVDRFVLARLEANGLSPSPEADRRTLIRRLRFDLTGLPPSPEEVDAFLADTSPGAYDRLVDRLLASPQYGERWCRHWLDVARYADTKGYVFFEESEFPWGWTYRDYVIESLNNDRPYDRFIQEQLAADLLPGSNPRALRALGFLTLGNRFMNNQHDVIDDRIDVVCRGLLGLTVTCARCHDHKFDPIPARDYYSLYGVFASSSEPTVPPLFEPEPTTETYACFAFELAEREGQLRDFVRQKHQELVEGAMSRAGEYLLAAHACRGRPGMEDFMLIADGNDLNPQMIVRWQSYLDRCRKRADPVFAIWNRFAELPEKDFAARAPIVLAGLLGDARLSGSLHQWLRGAFAGEPPRSMGEVARRYGTVLNAVESMTRRPVPLSAAAGAGLVGSVRAFAAPLIAVFHGPDAAPNVPASDVGDLALLPDRPSQAELQRLRKEVEQWRANGPGAPARAMTLRDEPVPTEPRVFVRGNPFNLGEQVPRQFVGVLAGKARKPFAAGSGRLELARAIASRDNPLTARVIVNRVWMHHFGRGLVTTPSDFGTRSDPPSHPELLDNLASWFVENGWSFKKLHKEIVLSAVYRQRSDDRPAGRALDPENVLLWRMNRQRLDFESTRDSLLAVSGRLDPTVGGPSFPNLFGTPRRTLYAHLDRLNLPGIYRTFDFPSPDATSPRRDQTTVPPQALFLMNHPFVADAARHVSERPDLVGLASPAERVGRLYRLLLGRPPTADEQALGLGYLTNKPSAAQWARYVQALLQTNEFVFVD